MDGLERHLLERRKVQIDEALVANAARLRAVPPHSFYRNYQRQELEAERFDLKLARNDTLRRLREFDTTASRIFRSIGRRKSLDPETGRVIAILDALEQEAHASTRRNIDRWEREGDYRQARIHRLAMISRRTELAKQYGYIPR